MTGVQVEVLGPLRLLVDGRPVDVRGPKRRALLALLATAGGRAVTVDYLLDALWADDLPESARAALQSHVSRLRTHLGIAGSRLQRLDGAYRLVLDVDGLDAARARALLTEARERRRDDPAGAYDLLTAARALWRGPTLAEFNEIAPLASAAVALEGLRRDVSDLLIGCALDAGRVDEVAEVAAEAVAAEPLREPAVLLRMRVLAATGQAPLALATARTFRRQLAAETGLDPSPELGELERAVAGGLVGGAPPPRAAPTAPLTPLVGRDAQVAALHRLLRGERLVTVVGPGGVGKTRLALEVASKADAVAVVRLAPVTDPAAIPHAFASALDLRVVQGDVLVACATLLASRPEVLMVDNCEHLLDAVRDTVATLLEMCPELTVLATSRVPLGLSGECHLRLAPLPPPSAEALFLDRARRVSPGFSKQARDLELVGHIVRRLDGMPLAIELAAGRLSAMSLAELSERLERSLDLLGGAGSADTRHRTLRAAIEWSYELLPEDERRLFSHLSVFVNGVDLATAEELAADLGLAGDQGAALAHLVDASMVDTILEDRTRYRMLETLRTFGLDRLAAAGETVAATNRLLRWAVALTVHVDAIVSTETEPEADATVRRELPNLRTAWQLARQSGLLDDAAVMVTCLYEVSAWRDLPEIRGWAEELANDGALRGHPRAALVLAAAAGAAYMRGAYHETRRLARAGLELAVDDHDRWQCTRSLALADLSSGAFTDVVRHELAAAPLAARPNAGFGVAALGATYAGDQYQARLLSERMAGQASSPTLRAFASYVDGEIDKAAGLLSRAEEHYLRAMALARASGATFIVGIASVGYVTACGEVGRVDDALRGYRDVIDYFARTGNWTHLWTTLRNLADLLRRLDDPEPAALLDAEADQAPDAPGALALPLSSGSAANRVRALDVARQAIARRLKESPD